jgi:hypothetical protein
MIRKEEEYVYWMLMRYSEYYWEHSMVYILEWLRGYFSRPKQICSVPVERQGAMII